MEKVLYPEIWPEEVMILMHEELNIMIVDVRQFNEWEEGHIPGAKHIPLGDISNRLNELDSQKEIIMVCQSGIRSGKACAILTNRGYQVVNMIGGMKSWLGEVETEK